MNLQQAKKLLAAVKAEHGESDNYYIWLATRIEYQKAEIIAELKTMLQARNLSEAILEYKAKPITKAEFL